MKKALAVGGSGESSAHRELKARGMDWLSESGCGIRAADVRLPLSRYRADVAGYGPVRRMGELGETFLLECKQSRADFLRDAGLETECLAEQASLREEAGRLRGLLARHLPDCRKGYSLFREFDTYDFSDLRHEKWRRSVKRLDQLERQLADGVKFSRMIRYGLANFCYLVVTPGVLTSVGEIPPG